MDWIVASAVAEVVGAVATIVTLIYLALQIRENTSALRAEARRADIISEAGAYDSIVGDREVAELFQNGLADPSTLDRADRARLAFLIAPFVGRAQLEFLEHQEGLRDSVLLNRNKSSRLRFLKTPGGRAYWEQQRKAYDPAFEAFVDEWLSSSIDGMESRPIAKKDAYDQPPS